jgi:heat shock protein HslJ
VIRGIIVGLAAACLFEIYGCTVEMSVPSKSDLIGAWTVQYIGERPVIDNSPAYLEFAADDRVGGNASCNRFTGGYALSGAQLSFSQAASTRMMCSPALMEQDGRFLESLEKVAEGKLENGRLALLDGDGNMLFRASRREGK